MHRSPRTRWAALRLAIVLCAVASVARGAEDRIGEIRFSGNDVTLERIMLQEMLIEPGDPADPDRIEHSRQAIMNLGLFKSVTAELLPGDERGRVLLVTVKEKYYILPFPKLNRNEDNQIGYGAELRLDNIAGRNQQLKVSTEREKSTISSSGEQDVYSVNYRYPRMFGGPWQLDVFVNRERVPIDLIDFGIVTGSYERTTTEGSVMATRLLNGSGPTRGWQFGGGISYRGRKLDLLSGQQLPYENRVGVGVIAVAEFSDIQDFLYSRAGKTYGINLEFGVRGLGSDTDYNRQLLYYRGYYPISMSSFSLGCRTNAF
jgi:outer membrane protein insertion porin family